VADAAWLAAEGYSTSLRSQYVAAGWLEQPARRVYRRPRGALSWQQVVVSLQALLGHHLAVGGRTALELLGYAHYLSAGPSDIHLYGPAPPPTWLETLPLKERFIYHNSKPMFGDDLAALSLPKLTAAGEAGADTETLLAEAGLRTLPWGQWNWPMTIEAGKRFSK
jgi:hypothetical protein